MPVTIAFAASAIEDQYSLDRRWQFRGSEPNGQQLDPSYLFMRISIQNLIMASEHPPRFIPNESRY